MEAVSITVALVALAVSVTSLVISLRPATLTLTPLHEHTEVSRGGVNGIPSMTDLRAQVALANVGARAGLLERIEFGVPSVNDAAARFAISVVPREAGMRLADMIELDEVPFTDPVTIEAGDVRSLKLNIGLAGDVRSAQHTRALPGHGPDREALARLIRDIDFVSIGIVATYRRGRGLFKQRRATGSIYLPGREFKHLAAEYWRESNPDLAAIIEAD